MDDLPQFPETTPSYFQCKASVTHQLPEDIFPVPLTLPKARHPRTTSPQPNITSNLLSVAGSRTIWVGYRDLIVRYEVRDSGLLERARAKVNGKVVAIIATKKGVLVGANEMNDGSNGWMGWYEEQDDGSAKEVEKVEIEGRICAIEADADSGQTERVLALTDSGKIIVVCPLEEQRQMVVHNAQEHLALAMCWVGPKRVAVSVDRGSVLEYEIVDSDVELRHKVGIKEVESGWIGRSVKYLRTERTKALLVSYVMDGADEEEVRHVLYDRDISDEGWMISSAFQSFFMRGFTEDSAGEERPSLLVVQVPRRDVVLVGSSQLYEFQLLGRGLDGWESWDFDESNVLLPMYGDSQDASPLGVSVSDYQDQSPGVATVWIFTSGAAITSYQLEDSRYAIESNEKECNISALNVEIPEQEVEEEEDSRKHSDSTAESSKSLIDDSLGAPDSTLQDVDALAVSLAHKSVLAVEKSTSATVSQGEEKVVLEKPSKNARSSSFPDDKTKMKPLSSLVSTAGRAHEHRTPSASNNALRSRDQGHGHSESQSIRPVPVPGALQMPKAKLATSLEAQQARSKYMNESSALASQEDPVSQIRSTVAEMKANLGTLRFLLQDTQETLNETRSVIPTRIESLGGKNLADVHSYIRRTVDIYEERHAAADVCLKNVSVLMSYAEELSSSLGSLDNSYENQDIDPEDLLMDKTISMKEKEIVHEIDAVDNALQRLRQQKSSRPLSKSRKVEHVETMQRLYSSLTLQGIRLKRVAGILHSLEKEIKVRRRETKTADKGISLTRIAMLSPPGTENCPFSHRRADSMLPQGTSRWFPLHLTQGLQRVAMKGGRESIKVSPGTVNTMVPEVPIPSVERDDISVQKKGSSRHPQQDTSHSFFDEETELQANHGHKADGCGRYRSGITKPTSSGSSDPIVKKSLKTPVSSGNAFEWEDSTAETLSSRNFATGGGLFGGASLSLENTREPQKFLPAGNSAKPNSQTMSTHPLDDVESEKYIQVETPSMKTLQQDHTKVHIPVAFLPPDDSEDTTSPDTSVTPKPDPANNTWTEKTGGSTPIAGRSDERIPFAALPPEEPWGVDQTPSTSKPVAIDSRPNDKTDKKPRTSSKLSDERREHVVTRSSYDREIRWIDKKKAQFAALPPEDSENKPRTEPAENITSKKMISRRDEESKAAGLTGVAAEQKERSSLSSDSLSRPSSHISSSTFGTSFSDSANAHRQKGVERSMKSEVDAAELSNPQLENSKTMPFGIESSKSSATGKPMLFGGSSGDKPSLFATLAANSTGRPGGFLAADMQSASASPGSKTAPIFGHQSSPAQQEDPFRQRAPMAPSDEKQTGSSGSSQPAQESSGRSGLGLEAAFGEQYKPASDTTRTSGLSQQSDSGIASQPNSIFGQKSGSSLNTQSSSGFAQRSGFGVEAAFGFGQSRGTAFGQQSGFGTKAGPGFGEPPVSGFGEQSEFGYRSQRPSSGFGEQTAGFGQQPYSGGFGQQSSSGFGQHSSPGFGQHSSPGFGQHSSPGFGQHSSPGFGQHSSPGFGQNSSSVFGQHSSSGFGQHSSSGFGQQGLSGFGHGVDSTSFGQSAPGTLGQSASGNTFGYAFGETARLGQANFGSGFGGGFGSPASGFSSQPSFGQDASVDRSSFGSQGGFGNQGPSPFAKLAAESDRQNPFGKPPPLPAIFSQPAEKRT